jgi:hypothetical protein
MQFGGGVSWCSSISIVLGYRLDNQAVEVRSPIEARDFSSNLCVHIGSGARPASCTLRTGGPFAKAEVQPVCDADCSLPSSAEVENE